MEQLNALKQVEGRLQLTADKVSVFQARLEDLLFRAQRMSSAQKNGLKNHDTMFGYELQNFRRDIRAFSNDLSTLPSALDTIDRTAAFEQSSLKSAQAVMRTCTRLSQELKNLNDNALLAHQHIRAADFKIEAWYLCQEIEVLARQGQTLPTTANKILVAVSTRSA